MNVKVSLIPAQLARSTTSNSLIVKNVNNASDSYGQTGNTGPNSELRNVIILANSGGEIAYFASIYSILYSILEPHIKNDCINTPAALNISPNG